MIPKIIHTFWQGPSNDIVARNIGRIAEVNPGYELHVHDESMKVLPKWRPAFDHWADCPRARSDVARMNLLERYGGWWLDSDVLCCRSLDVLAILGGGERLIVPPLHYYDHVHTFALGCPKGLGRFWLALDDHLNDPRFPWRRMQFCDTYLTDIWKQNPELFHMLDRRLTSVLDPQERRRCYEKGAVPNGKIVLLHRGA